MTPCFKAAPNAFVAKRSNYSALPDFSPLPDTLSHVADEDTWLKMNGGYIADLDSLHITPSRKVQSFPPNEATPVSPFFLFTCIIRLSVLFLLLPIKRKRYKFDLLIFSSLL